MKRVVLGRSAEGGVRRWLGGANAFAARHWLLLVILGAGAALRAVTFFAYQPALLNSIEYLMTSEALSPGTVHPIGYAAFLRLLPLGGGLWVVPLVQHLLGLGIAALLYALLLELGVRRWLAALATAPLLLDSYQLSIEQYATPETLFELLLVGGCALLLSRRAPGPAFAAIAGIIFATAAVTRTIGVLAVIPAGLTVLFLRAGLVRALAFLFSFLLLLGGYAAWYHSYRGEYALTGSTGLFLYGRVAPFVDCGEFSKPPYEEVLCPKEPVGERLPVNELLWSDRFSPVRRIEALAGETHDEVAMNFAKRAIANQPVAYARDVLADVLRAFAPTRGLAPGEFGAPPWQFHRRYPILFRGSVCSPEATQQVAEELSVLGHTAARSREVGCRLRRRKVEHVIRVRGDVPRVDGALTGFLVGYQRFGYTPGPVLAAGLLVGLAAALGAGRARRSGLRSPPFLFLGIATLVCLGSLFITVFSWRYQIPQLVLLPPAAALGVTALTSTKPQGRSGLDERPPLE
jgi:hypothetical protein